MAKKTPAPKKMGKQVPGNMPMNPMPMKKMPKKMPKGH